MTKTHQSLKVLVVDDNTFSLSVVDKALRKIGVREIATAADGREALSHLNSHLTDVIICDLNMPEMDGIEFLRHLAAADFAGSILLVSGEDRRILDTAEKLAGAHNLNVLGAVEKPIRSSVLAEFLDRSVAEIWADQGKPASRVSREELAAGLANQELVIYFQPKVDMSTQAVLGAECLVRWLRPDGTMIWPDAFIPVAEEHGLIDDVTRTVFKLAVEQGGNWRANGLDLKIAINISMDNLRRIDFPEFITDFAETAGMETENIILEVTESQLMEDILTPLEILTRLRLKGISLSIDDFGTGYSSMEQLKSIPFTEMKIDRAFVNGAARDPAALAILESSVDLAKKLDMSVVAEGAETQEDWDLVARLGVDLVQGYFVAKPMPADEFAAWSKK
jgi:EAL domain-containing protein (putative c-di-GMP-specific phosphodiesterase class I)/AmiR/NasT family two-component response regulator